VVELSKNESIEPQGCSTSSRCSWEEGIAVKDLMSSVADLIHGWQQCSSAAASTAVRPHGVGMLLLYQLWDPAPYGSEF
jgi:hypothetical protein